MKLIYKIVIFIFVAFRLPAQTSFHYPSFQASKDYSWIKYNDNKLQFPGKSKFYFDYFFEEMRKLYSSQNQQLKILQFGDSHVQADFFGEEFRNNFAKIGPKDLILDRGIIFPYGVAKTNNPGNYSVAYQGNWSVLKSTDKSCTEDIGIAGIAIKTNDPDAAIEIVLNPNKQIMFTVSEITLFHSTDISSAKPYLIYKNNVIFGTTDEDAGYTRFSIPHAIDTIKIGFNFIPNSPIRNITVYGLSANNKNRGVSFSSLGVNGATIASLKRCNLMEKQLAAVNPDMIILSFGTNDAFYNFNRVQFEEDYKSIIALIRNNFPQIPIVLTTPADGMRNGNEAIYEIAAAAQAIYKIAKENNCAVWDFYKIMGGTGSIGIWEEYGLANKDKVHFLKKGYQVEADLFFEAFYSSFIDYTQN